MRPWKRPVPAWPFSSGASRRRSSYLKELKFKESIAKSATDESKKMHDLDPSKAVHVVASGGSAKLDISFGKSGGRGQMAMIDGKPGIYTVSSYTSFFYTRDAKGWQ